MEFIWAPVTLNEVITIKKSKQYVSRTLEKYITQNVMNKTTNSTMMIPIGALRFIKDVLSMQHDTDKNILFIFGDKTFGSRTSFVLSGEKEHEYPTIVHHGEKEKMMGCVSTSVDLSLVSSFIIEETNSKEVASLTTSRQCKQIEDRTTGSGGEFDVHITSTSSGIIRWNTFSVCDVQTIVNLAEFNLNNCTIDFLLHLITITNYDYTVFRSVCWNLLKKITSTTNKEIILNVGEKCFHNWYIVIEHKYYYKEYYKSLLMYTRWLYVQGAYKECIRYTNKYIKFSIDSTSEMQILKEQIGYLWLRASSKKKVLSNEYESRVEYFKNLFPNCNRDLSKR
jgi:hypothetical protein